MALVVVRSRFEISYVIIFIFTYLVSCFDFDKYENKYSLPSKMI